MRAPIKSSLGTRYLVPDALHTNSPLILPKIFEIGQISSSFQKLDLRKVKPSFSCHVMSYQLENDVLSYLRKVQIPSLKSPPLHCAFQFLLIFKYALVLYSSRLYQFCLENYPCFLNSLWRQVLPTLPLNQSRLHVYVTISPSPINHIVIVQLASLKRIYVS